MHCRTVATARAGKKPDNLQQLANYHENTITKNLLANGNNVVKGRSVESASTLIVTREGIHHFHYELNPQSAEIQACNEPVANGETICYDCYYDLEIRITGTCDQEPIVITRSNFSFGNYDVDCGTGPPAMVIDEDETLSEGEYNITKKLTLSRNAQDWYRDNVFLQKNICKTLQDFYDENYAILSQGSDCNEVTCESCTATLGTETQYRQHFLEQQGIDPNTTVDYEDEIKASFEEAKANCAAICSQAADNKLAGIRQMMLEDMTPAQGQYALLDEDLDESGATNNPNAIYYDWDKNKQYPRYEMNSARDFNIFNTNKNAYRFPKLENGSTGFYLDENNAVDESIQIPYPDQDPNLPKKYKPISATPEDFTVLFGKNWASSLIYYHPEFPRLQFAEKNFMASYNWDVTVEETDTWQAAVTAGLITNIFSLDPFFNSTAANARYKTGRTYKQEMQFYLNSEYKAKKTMWQLAWILVNCPDLKNGTCINSPLASPPYNPNTCPGDWNAVWRMFRSFYLSEKDKLLNDYLDKHTPTAIDYTKLKTLHYQRRFGGAADLDPALNDLATIAGNAQNAGQAQAAGDGYVNPKLQEQYAANCDGYIALWKSRLENCDQLMSLSNHEAIIASIVAQMKDVCIRGSDNTHTDGSSSVKPGDTKNPQSFEQIISNVLTSNNITITNLCNPYIIDFPEPYDKQTPVSDATTVSQKDPCVCSQLGKIQNEQVQAGYTGTLSSFIKYQHGVDIRQTLLDSLVAGCNGTSGCNMYDPALTIPAILHCTASLNNCIGCSEYDALKKQFQQQYPSYATIIYENPQSDEEVNQNILFEKFMNYSLGFNKSWLEYLAFENTCKAFGPTWTCTKLDSIVSLYYQSHSSNAYGAECQSVFTQFFNQAFGTAYTFADIKNLFLQYCGRFPDVCEPTIDCPAFKNLINAFYNQYGAAIAVAGNCQELFVTFFNTTYGSGYTWEQLEALYRQGCGQDFHLGSPFKSSRV